MFLLLFYVQILKKKTNSDRHFNFKIYLWDFPFSWKNYIDCLTIQYGIIPQILI